MKRYIFDCETIKSAGYDAQCALLEIEFARSGQIWQYAGVSEETWYHFKSEAAPDSFFHTCIKGRFQEKQVIH